jgi:hypothetical protein
MSTTTRNTRSGRTPHQRFGNPRLQEEVHDPYRATVKARGPRRCPDCGATYVAGRWRWQTLKPRPAALQCPACRRVHDRYPAGEIVLSGQFMAEHVEEILHLVRNVAAAENRDHPLHRLMDVRRQDDTLVITTTDVHLPRRIGHALEGAWRGILNTHYDEQGYFARVTWERDD